MTDETINNPQDFINAAKDFEVSKSELLKRSNKRAWALVFVFAVAFLIAVFALLVAVFQRVEPEPVIIEVDKSNGISSVRRALKDKNDTYEEVVNRHEVWSYISARESYDWYRISKDFDEVKLRSTPSVFNEYEKSIRSDSSPLTNLKTSGRILTKHISTTFLKENVAQVRFTTQIVKNNGIDSSPEQPWISTVTFFYDHTKFMKPSERLLNPLSFTANSYKKESEILQ